MKITIDTKVLGKNKLSLGEFLVLLANFASEDLVIASKEVQAKGLASADLFDPNLLVLSDNTKNLVQEILVDSSVLLDFCKDVKDYNMLAEKLRSMYPKGCKPGTIYPWSSTTKEIALKLKTLVVEHSFFFSSEEAEYAVEAYITQCRDHKKDMQLLKNFILKTYSDGNISSLFMTLIENRRERLKQHEESKH